VVASLTLIDLVASGKRERNISMYQLHYFPANASAATPMLPDEIAVEYHLALVDRAKNVRRRPVRSR
jgi:thioesterase domain-containing protein